MAEGAKSNVLPGAPSGRVVPGLNLHDVAVGVEEFNLSIGGGICLSFRAEWHVRSAKRARGNSTITFLNRRAVPEPDECAGLFAVGADEYLLRNVHELAQFGARASLPPLTGGYGRGAVVAYVTPLSGVALDEHTILLVGLLALSSLCRYQPEVWTACVHRRQIGNRPIDDVLLPVIEAFLDHVMIAFPTLVTEVLLQR